MKEKESITSEIKKEFIDKIIRGKIKEAITMLNESSELAHAESEGFAALPCAAQMNSIILVENLLNKGANINCRSFNSTALHVAIDSDFVEITKLLLIKGANIHIRNEQGHEAQDVALSSRNPNIKTLMSDFLNQGEALLQATMVEQLDVVKTILTQYPHVINYVDKDGTSVLHYAAVSNNAIITNLLLDKGASINSQDTQGHTAVHLALENKPLTVARILIEQGANLYLPDKNGLTARNKIENTIRGVDLELLKGAERAYRNASTTANRSFATNYQEASSSSSITR